MSEPIRIPRPTTFDSPLATAVFRVERLRTELKMIGDGDSSLHRELRELFQWMTSMMSARIEGNRTTVVDALQGAVDAQNGIAVPDGVREILLLDHASDMIDEVVDEDFVFTQHFIRALHQKAVDGLIREGDRTPGAYRTGEVRISQAQHVPPGPESIQAEMTQLVDFMNEDLPPQLQLLQVAVTHHRFVWIHPFGNGNGRVSRLLTYAMLVKLGFTSSAGFRALNPTVVFGADRQQYYDQLAGADSLSEAGLARWCRYVLEGLAEDAENIVRLSRRETVLRELYIPSVWAAQAAGAVSEGEARIVCRVAELDDARAKDLEALIPGSPSARSHRLTALVDRGLLRRPEGRRIYRARVFPSPLTTHVVRRLDELGMLPALLRDQER